MKDKELLDLVRLSMTERNVSQRDMAREMETSPQNVSHWLDRTETLSKMARAKLKAWLGDRYDAPRAPMSSGDCTRAIGEIMRSDMCDVCKVKAYAILSRLRAGRRRGLTGSLPCLKAEGPLSHAGQRAFVIHLLFFFPVSGGGDFLGLAPPRRWTCFSAASSSRRRWSLRTFDATSCGTLTRRLK